MDIRKHRHPYSMELDRRIQHCRPRIFDHALSENYAMERHFGSDSLYIFGCIKRRAIWTGFISAIRDGIQRDIYIYGVFNHGIHGRHKGVSNPGKLRDIYQDKARVDKFCDAFGFGISVAGDRTRRGARID